MRDTRVGLNTLLAAAAISMAGVFGGMPPGLGQLRRLSSRPGSGLVRSTGRSKPRRDDARQAAAQAKRERKSLKRMQDAYACWRGNPCRRDGYVTKGNHFGQ